MSFNAVAHPNAMYYKTVFFIITVVGHTHDGKSNLILIVAFILQLRVTPHFFYQPYSVAISRLSAQRNPSLGHTHTHTHTPSKK